ncbi:hypothetical protein AB0F88_08695 [Streptosporangium sp. NPDC023963]
MSVGAEKSPAGEPERGFVIPAVGCAASGDPAWASRADEDLEGFGE